MKIVSADEMREIDRITSDRFGVPSLTLMENAGSAVADFVISRYHWAKRIGVVCGKGNNGGDGFVTARKLVDAGKEVQVLLLANPLELQGDAAVMLSKLPLVPAIARSAGELKQHSTFSADVLVDAILGTGFKPPVSGFYAAAIGAINTSRRSVVAVDIPSGADADAMNEQQSVMVRAEAVVTFTAPRLAHIFGHLTAGPTVIAPIGSPEDAIISSLQLNVITPRDIAPLVGPRPADSNKGSFGHVLVIGGSLGKAGAAAMAGISALRSGAGLSTVATPKSVQATVAGFHPELMTESLQETDAGSLARRALDSLSGLIRGMTVLAIGPGISRNAETAGLVRALVKDCATPVVLDADGLNAFENRANELDGQNRTLVITPHPGEMARLLGSTIADVQKDRIQTARQFAREHQVIVVLKGNRTLVAHPHGAVWVNTTGNPGMATGGTGDLLTGITAGMMAQHPEDPLLAVLCAVHLHGLAGDVARESMGEHSLVATDLLPALPEAFRRIRAAAEHESVEIGE